MDEFHFEMKYKVNQKIDPEKYWVSIGAIQLNIPEKLRFDFTDSSWFFENQEDGICIVHAWASDFDAEIYQEDYDSLGLSVDDMNFEFFSKHLDKTQVAEVYTELYAAGPSEEVFLPLKLESLIFVFPNEGKTIDLTGKISEECQTNLSYV